MAQDFKNKKLGSRYGDSSVDTDAAADADVKALDPAPAAEKQDAKPVAAASVKKAASVYVGPALRRGDMLLSRFQVFRSLPAAVAERCKRDADFSRLFVEPAELAMARKQLSDRGTLLARSFQAVFSNSLKGGN